MIISKQDFAQIRKDIDRISLHPILKTAEVRAHLTSVLHTLLVTNNLPVPQVSYI